MCCGGPFPLACARARLREVLARYDCTAATLAGGSLEAFVAARVEGGRFALAGRAGQRHRPLVVAREAFDGFHAPRGAAGAALVVLLVWMPVMAIGQAGEWWSLRTADSSGFVPIERLQLTKPSNAPSWWQRTAQNHLFDFSDADRTQNLVVVDPVVQAFAGSIRTTDAAGNPQARTWWDNIRGARFQAIIDGKWQLGGELLERQGLAEPLLGYWAATDRIPGWGRAKVGYRIFVWQILMFMRSFYRLYMTM